VSLVSLGNSGPSTLLVGPLKQKKDECSIQGMVVDEGRAKSREKEDYSSVILNFINVTCTALDLTTAFAVRSQQITACTMAWVISPLTFKDETSLFYAKTRCVPRSKHSPLRLYKTNLLMFYKVKVHTEHLNAM
jgi:hypothetical protein